MFYLLFKITNPDTGIGVSKIKYEIDKAIVAKFENKVKYFLDDMSSKYSIIIDKGEHHEYYACQIFRDLLSGPKSTSNCLT